MTAQRGSERRVAYRGILGILLVVLAHAASVRADVGAGRLGLPAADRVLIPSTQHAPIAIAASGGYGVIESQSGEGAHHRTAGDLAVALSLVPNVAVSLAFDGRYDRHPKGDDDAVGLPQLSLVGAFEVEHGLRLGAAFQLSVPGDSAPSLRFSAPTLAMTGLLAWSSRGFTLAALAGFRLDESGRAAPDDLSRLSAADRLALGLSAYNALPIGIAAFQRFEALEVFGELSGEFLVGSTAPSLLHSPLRAALGLRLPLIGDLHGEALAELGLSQRPPYLKANVMIPIEPRFGISVGLRYAFGRSPEPVRSAPPPPPPRAAPTRTDLTGQVLDPDGTPLHGVRITVAVGSEHHSVLSDGEGQFAFSSLPEGTLQIIAEGEGLITTSETLELRGPTVTVLMHVARVVAGAQLRGLVRSFSSVPLQAQVQVLPAGRVVLADKDGRFVLELPAGEYEVQIECDGYLTQRRKISVQDNGVTLLDVELHEAP